MAFDFVGIKGLVKPLIFLGCLAFLCLSLAACQPAPSDTFPTRPPQPTLIPYLSPTPQKLLNSTDSLSLTALPSSTPTALPSPTATPYIYRVKKGDTLLGIALHYGLTLEALQAANPKVNPNFLSVGTELVIPISLASKLPTATPSPTPLPLSIDSPRCFPQEKTGAWCVAQVSNRQPYAVDNLQVWFSLADSSGAVLTRTQVTPLLDWIPSGDTLPLMAFFPAGALPSAIAGLTARAELVNANQVPAVGGRYLPLHARLGQAQISPDGLQAVVQGQIDYPLPSASQTPGAAASATPPPTPSVDQIKANVIWVLVIAYDKQGQVVGARRWEADKGLKLSGSMEFSQTVYSLGPPIDHIEVILEARNQ
jgi:LysM repeat protein